MDNYTFGKCIRCNKVKVLKNDACIDCNKKIEIPDFLKDLLK